MTRGSARRLAAAALLAACTRDGAPPAGDSGATTRTSSSQAVAGGRRPACEHTGHWTPCLVKERLEQSGMVPLPAEPIDGLPALGVAPVEYRLGNATVALYLFPNAAARERAARSLDTAKFIAPTAPLTMRGEATAIQNDNLLALLFSRNDHQRERVGDALTAGTR